jgi:2-dehydro-3-deoxygluconokinase
MNANAAQIACIGECMIEVACLDDGLRGSRAQLGFGGDTLNTALYLARQGVGVDYHTALGDDASSAAMIDAWREEGIGTGEVEIVSGATPGLYMIRTDAYGERSFQFWREHSPARRLCALPGWALRARRLQAYGWLYFSAITLSILGEDGRIALLEAVADARAQGARVAFDSNYRPRHWIDPGVARRAIKHALAHTDLALPTFEDERALYGDASPHDTLARLSDLGVATAAIKLGAEGCLLHDRHGSRRIAALPVSRVVDTTAAGDAFNAGLLAGLMRGDSTDHAALLGHRLAGVVIQHRGAIAPRNATSSDALVARPTSLPDHAA